MYECTIIFMESYPNYPEKPEYVVLEAMNRIGLHPKHRHLIGKLAVDFAFPELKLAVELDGEHHHEADKELRGAQERDEYLKSMGWRVYRIPATRALQSPPLIAQSVLGFIKQTAPAERAVNTEAPKKAEVAQRKKVQSKGNAKSIKSMADRKRIKGKRKQTGRGKKSRITKKQHIQEYAKHHKQKITKLGGRTNTYEVKNLMRILLGLLVAAFILIAILNNRW